MIRRPGAPLLVRVWHAHTPAYHPTGALVQQLGRLRESAIGICAPPGAKWPSFWLNGLVGTPQQTAGPDGASLGSPASRSAPQAYYHTASKHIY